MQFPDIHADTSWQGNWVGTDDLEPVIRTQCRLFHARYGRFYYGDDDDLAQSARLAIWQLKQERLREMVAFGTIYRAIWDEIRDTQRLGPDDVPASSVNWKTLTTARPQLNETQQGILYRFGMKASQIAKRPYWECCWLVKGCEWQPIDVTLYFRAKKDDRHFYSPETVCKMVKKGEDRIRKKLDPLYVEELNQLDGVWW